MSAPTGGWEEARWRDVREAVEQHRNQRELSEILAELADEEMLESAADLEAVQCSIARIDELAERERAVAEREQAGCGVHEPDCMRVPSQGPYVEGAVRC